MDDVTWLMPPPAGIVATNTLVWATGGELYVNPGDGYSDDNDGLTPATAKKTLQAAVNAATNNYYTIVHAAEGVYDEGGSFDASASNRVTVVNAKRILLRGAGAGKSVIKGLADTTSGETDGRGDFAMRCVCLNNADYSVVQGFTLTDGHARTGNDAGANQNMGGLRLGCQQHNLPDTRLRVDERVCRTRRGGVARTRPAVRHHGQP